MKALLGEKFKRAVSLGFSFMALLALQKIRLASLL
jgi:hypothetical protein